MSKQQGQRNRSGGSGVVMIKDGCSGNSFPENAFVANAGLARAKEMGNRGKICSRERCRSIADCDFLHLRQHETNTSARNPQRRGENATSSSSSAPDSAGKGKGGGKRAHDDVKHNNNNGAPNRNSNGNRNSNAKEQRSARGGTSAASAKPNPPPAGLSSKATGQQQVVLIKLATMPFSDKCAALVELLEQAPLLDISFLVYLSMTVNEVTKVTSSATDRDALAKLLEASRLWIQKYSAFLTAEAIKGDAATHEQLGLVLTALLHRVDSTPSFLTALSDMCRAFENASATHKNAGVKNLFVKLRADLDPKMAQFMGEGVRSAGARERAHHSHKYVPDYKPDAAEGPESILIHNRSVFPDRSDPIEIRSLAPIVTDRIIPVAHAPFHLRQLFALTRADYAADLEGAFHMLSSQFRKIVQERGPAALLTKPPEDVSLKKEFHLKLREADKDRLCRYLYNSVFVVHQLLKRNINGLVLELKLETSQFPDPKMLLQGKRLMHGNLLVLSKTWFTDPAERLIFGTIHKEKMVEQGTGRRGNFRNNSLGRFMTLHLVVEDASFLSEVSLTELAGLRFQALESQAFFTPYHRVLEALQQLSEAASSPLRNRLIAAAPPSAIPMPRALLLGETNEVPRYLVAARTVNVSDAVLMMPGRRDGVLYLDDNNLSAIVEPWSEVLEAQLAAAGGVGKRHVLDKTQAKALQHMFSHKVSIVQGTPGTGKTFIGAKFIQILLENNARASSAQKNASVASLNTIEFGNILVVAQTNHAIDAVLEDILPHIDKRDSFALTRLGARSQNETIASSYTFSSLAKDERIRPRIQGMQEYHALFEEFDNARKTAKKYSDFILMTDVDNDEQAAAKRRGRDVAKQTANNNNNTNNNNNGREEDFVTARNGVETAFSRHNCGTAKARYDAKREAAALLPDVKAADDALKMCEKSIAAVVQNQKLLPTERRDVDAYVNRLDVYVKFCKTSFPALSGEAVKTMRKCADLILSEFFDSAAAEEDNNDAAGEDGDADKDMLTQLHKIVKSLSGVQKRALSVAAANNTTLTLSEAQLFDVVAKSIAELQSLFKDESAIVNTIQNSIREEVKGLEAENAALLSQVKVLEQQIKKAAADEGQEGNKKKKGKGKKGGGGKGDANVNTDKDAKNENSAKEASNDNDAQEAKSDRDPKEADNLNGKEKESTTVADAPKSAPADAQPTAQKKKEEPSPSAQQRDKELQQLKNRIDAVLKRKKEAEDQIATLRDHTATIKSAVNKLASDAQAACPSSTPSRPLLLLTREALAEQRKRLEERDELKAKAETLGKQFDRLQDRIKTLNIFSWRKELGGGLSRDEIGRIRAELCLQIYGRSVNAHRDGSSSAKKSNRADARAALEEVVASSQGGDDNDNDDALRSRAAQVLRQQLLGDRYDDLDDDDDKNDNDDEDDDDDDDEMLDTSGGEGPKRTMRESKDLCESLLSTLAKSGKDDKLTREMLFQCACICGQIETGIQMENILKQAMRKGKTIRNIDDTSRAEFLSKFKVIGATTTGCAGMLSVMRHVRPKVIIVEEAAEVLESHVIACLTEGAEHLILIGDHKQLQPKTTNEFSLGRDKNLAVSLMERLVRLGAPYVTLTTQRRMHPDISAFHKSYYLDADSSRNEKPEKVIDHPRTLLIPAPMGVMNNTRVLLVGHDGLGVRSEKKDEGMQSYYNDYESQLAMSIYEHLWRANSGRATITILVPYAAHTLHTIKWAEKLGINTRKAHDVGGVWIASIDDYQGEEDDFVIICLTRTTESGFSNGFLRARNRVCVALSRAKRGMYVIGCLPALRRAQNPLWVEFLSTLQCRKLLPATAAEAAAPSSSLPPAPAVSSNNDDPSLSSAVTETVESEKSSGTSLMSALMQKARSLTSVLSSSSPSSSSAAVTETEKSCIVDAFPAVCPTHPTTDLSFSSREQAVKNKGCGKMCEETMDCGHLCQKTCHFGTNAHGECRQKCERVGAACNPSRLCAHLCKKFCKEACGTCDEKVQRTCKRCGTEATYTCGGKADGEKVETCSHPITDTADCGHTVTASCREWEAKNAHKRCKAVCDEKMPCTHLCKKKCHHGTDDDHSAAVKMCVETKTVTNTCGDHRVQVKCNTDPSKYPACVCPCTGRASCGHPCEAKCGACKPTQGPHKCSRPTPRTLSCGHTETVPCDADDPRCSAPCLFVHHCGHPCVGTCGVCNDSAFEHDHTPCKASCGKVLLCGHPCQGSCDHAVCPPCLLGCGYSCGHGAPCDASRKKGPSQQRHNCSECPNRECQNNCLWQCPHTKCDLKCFEPCTRPVCDAPCEGAPPSQHRRGGGSGEEDDNDNAHDDTATADKNNNNDASLPPSQQKPQQCRHTTADGKSVCLGVCGEQCPDFCRGCFEAQGTAYAGFKRLKTLGLLLMGDGEKERCLRGEFSFLSAEDRARGITEASYRLVDLPCCGSLMLSGELDASIAEQYGGGGGAVVSGDSSSARPILGPIRCPLEECNAPMYPHYYKRQGAAIRQRWADIGEILRREEERRSEAAEAGAASATAALSELLIHIGGSSSSTGGDAEEVVESIMTGIEEAYSKPLPVPPTQPATIASGNNTSRKKKNANEKNRQSKYESEKKEYDSACAAILDQQKEAFDKVVAYTDACVTAAVSSSSSAAAAAAASPCGDNLSRLLTTVVIPLCLKTTTAAAAAMSSRDAQDFIRCVRYAVATAYCLWLAMVHVRTNGGGGSTTRTTIPAALTTRIADATAKCLSNPHFKKVTDDDVTAVSALHLALQYHLVEEDFVNRKADDPNATPKHIVPKIRTLQLTNAHDPDTIMWQSLVRGAKTLMGQHDMFFRGKGNPTFYPNKCAESSCSSLQRFFNGMKAAGMDAQAVAAVGGVRFAFHGTSPDAIGPISCRGFDVLRRRGQAYGPGEYFSPAPNVSEGYAKGSECLFICAIIPDPRIFSDNQHFVVNNPVNTPEIAFVVPVGVCSWSASRQHHPSPFRQCSYPVASKDFLSHESAVDELLARYSRASSLATQSPSSPAKIYHLLALAKAASFISWAKTAASTSMSYIIDSYNAQAMALHQTSSMLPTTAAAGQTLGWFKCFAARHNNQDDNGDDNATDHRHHQSKSILCGELFEGFGANPTCPRCANA